MAPKLRNKLSIN